MHPFSETNLVTSMFASPVFFFIMVQ